MKIRDALAAAMLALLAAPPAHAAAPDAAKTQMPARFNQVRRTVSAGGIGDA